MVSKKTTQTIILGALTLGGLAGWSAYTSKSTDGNVRPAVVPSLIQQAGHQPSGNTPDRTGGKEESVSTSARSHSGHAMTTSATSTKQSADSSRIEAFTEPYCDIAIAASEMGTLSSVNVKEGDDVKSGDVIAVMSDEVLKASLEVARRSMNVEGTLKSAAADVALRQTELAKLEALRQRDHASQKEVDRVLTELLIAQARHLSVREDLEIKQLEFRRIEAQLKQRCIRSPIAGIVSDLPKDVGEFVSPSDPVVARVVQLDPLLVVFSVPLAHRHDFQKDQTVTLQLGESDLTVEGTIEFVSRTTDSSNSSIRVKVRVPNPNGEFQSGERALLKLNPQASPGNTASTSDEIASPVSDRNHETTSRQ